MTTRSATSKTITIFEGPDGGGKSTMAKALAIHTGALYIHHDSYKHVRENLWRMFAESMLPALMGYQDVILDRCWVSEPIYGRAFRGGHSRMCDSGARMLDRMALRCGAVIVRCLPPWERVQKCFNGRIHEEMLNDDTQLRMVYDQYADDDYFDRATQLHGVDYDYLADTRHVDMSTAAWRLNKSIEAQRAKTPLHPVQVQSAGNLNGSILIVGENFAAHHDRDLRYQLPFCSMSGCSPWLNRQLHEAGISELNLVWINADELERYPDFIGKCHNLLTIVPLGQVASSVVISKLGLHKSFEVVGFAHPQYNRRFQTKEPYTLMEFLKEKQR